MTAAILIACGFLQGALPATAQNPSVAQSAATPATNLAKVTRIYVESFGDDAASRQFQAMIVSALVATKRFVVTENRDHADAVLKGSAIEKTAHEVHAYGEGTSVGVAKGGAYANSNGAAAAAVGEHLGESDSSVNTETVEDAQVAIRLVSSDGDVIWSTTQESKGGKYKGASADAVDECVRQLLHDADRAASGGGNR